VCGTGTPECKEQIESVGSADYIDLRYDAISQSLIINTFRSQPAEPWRETLQPVGTHKNIEVGVLGNEKPIATESLTLGGFLHVVGKDDKLGMYPLDLWKSYADLHFQNPSISRSSRDISDSLLNTALRRLSPLVYIPGSGSPFLLLLPRQVTIVPLTPTLPYPGASSSTSTNWALRTVSFYSPSTSSVSDRLLAKPIWKNRYGLVMSGAAVSSLKLIPTVLRRRADLM
jgi:hypothetical protein